MASTGTTAIAFLSCISIIGVISNLFACYVMYTRETPISFAARYYLLSLAITDILVGAVSIPLYLFLISFWTELDHRQQLLFGGIWGSIDVICQVASIVHLCIIGLDRALAVRKPLYHRKVAIRRNILVTLVIVWTVSFIAGLPNVIIIRYIFGYVVYFSILVGVFYVIPLFIIISSYMLIIITVKRRNDVSTLGQINEKKIIATFFAVTLTFLLCWTPYVIAALYTVIKVYVTGSASDGHLYLTVTECINYLGSVVNPFIYVVLQSQFRQALKEICQKLTNKRNPPDVSAQELNEINEQ